MLRKITRILFKTVVVFFSATILLAIIGYFAIQSHTFQTWLGKKVSTYLSSELNATLKIDKIELDFFKKFILKGVLVKDQKSDTLFGGDIDLYVKKLNYKNKELTIDKIYLKNSVTKIIQYKNDSTFNFQYLADYFSGDSGIDTSSGKKWEVNPGELFLENVSFILKNENYSNAVTRNLNFDFLSFKNTSGKISNIKIGDESFGADIRNLKTEEQSGFKLINLTTNAQVSFKNLSLKRLTLQTNHSLIKGKIIFKYTDWEDYSDFMNRIRMDCQLEKSICNFGDIAFFTSALNGLNESVYLDGKIKGYITDLNLKDFNLAYGSNTRFNGDLVLTGIPKLTTGFLSLNAKRLSTSYEDLKNIPMYPFNEGKKMELPEIVQTMGLISYQGRFDGFLSDFAAKGIISTAQGKIKTDVRITVGDEADDTQYDGFVETVNFDAGALGKLKGINGLTFNGHIKGKGLSMNAINTSITGHIANINYNKYGYKNIDITGLFKEKVFNGELTSKDPNADFTFDGTVNFKNKIPEMDFISTLNHVNLKELHFSTEKAIISSQILIVLKGDNLDNLTGNINLDNTIFTNPEKEFKLSTFDLNLEQEFSEKKIKLTSNYFNYDMQGKFNLSNLPLAFNHFLSSYYPAFIKKQNPKQLCTDAFTFTIKVKKFETIKELVVKSLMISPNTIIKGDFDITKNLFNINLNSDSVQVGNIAFNNSKIESFSKNNKINIVIKATDIELTDSVKLENYFSYFVSQDKETKFNFEWDNKLTPKNAGKIFGKVFFEKELTSFNLEKFFITAKDSTWNLTQTSPITLDTVSRLMVNPLTFINNQQSISLVGALAKNTSDSLVMTSKNVALEQFNPLLQSIGLNLKGDMSGNLSLYNADGFAFGSDLEFAKLDVNKNFLGQMVLKTKYNAQQKNIELNGYTSLGIPDIFGYETKNISFNGFYYMDDRDETIDIDFKASPANLKLLNPMLEGIMTINNALVVGGGKIHGSAKNVMIDGKLKLYSSEIKIDYTNVTYNITGEIDIMPDQIRFSELRMKEKGSKSVAQGTINGNIFHSNFNRMQLDYDVTYRNMMVLNTTEKENKTYYGKMYGSGNIGIWGFLTDLHMQVRDTTNKNSKFFMPLDGPAEVEESDFIHFVRKDSVKTKKDELLTGFNLDMQLNITPDLQAQIILDKRTGDILNVQGMGDLTLKINTLGKFEMLGDYIMTDGDYRFTLENVINKKFDIDAGSSISWSGDPLGAEIDIITSYRQRASVAALLNDTSGMYKSRVPVDCKLKISEKLFSPNIKFMLNFPTIDATAKARINNLLSDEMELNRQVFSFLLFRTFVTPQIYNANGGGVSAGGAAANTGSELLSNQVSSFLNNYVGNLTGMDDLNLGLNYRPGSDNNSEAVDLALSKQLFNNKVSIDGNFGVNNNQTNRNSSGIIDVNIEYKLTDDGRYRVKGFNRSNDNTQITTTGGPYTQGIGLFYREEFESFNELFSRYLKKIKGKEKTKPDAN
ncbi:MAG: translocation/assembly module TamB [Sphingobacteriaceae bacterium]|nr:translocation/assembly module TamB [Sphingobacteriaceae bacterium]